MKKFYAKWLIKFGHVFMLFGMLSSGLTSSWVVQNILRDSFGVSAGIFWILLVEFCLLVTLSLVMSRLGLIQEFNQTLYGKNDEVK